MGASQARNLDYYLQRMSGYSKNTIKLQPQTKYEYYAGDTVIFRLPTNSIIDLHTLTLRFNGQLLNLGAAAPAPAAASGVPTAAEQTAINAATAAIAWPKNTSSLIRRNDWTMGGMQAGCGSLHDYGFLYNLLSEQKSPFHAYFLRFGCQ